MRVRVNGEDVTVPAAWSVGELVAAHTGTAERRGFAVAVNGDIVPRSTWDAARVGDGDDVEITAPLQGG